MTLDALPGKVALTVIHVSGNLPKVGLTDARFFEKSVSVDAHTLPCAICAAVLFYLADMKTSFSPELLKLKTSNTDRVDSER